MTRSVRDASLLFETLQGSDRRDATSRKRDRVRQAVAQSHRATFGKRIVFADHGVDRLRHGQHSHRIRPCESLEDNGQAGRMVGQCIAYSTPVAQVSKDAPVQRRRRDRERFCRTTYRARARDRVDKR